MQRKETLFEYLYHSLREEIISGRMPFGSTLPSIMRLCELYHVGIRTVRDVLERLKQEGYIKTEERKPMLVIYRQDQREQETAAVTYIVKYQQSLRDAYATMTLIMPRILSFSVQVCSDYTLHCMKESVEEAAEKNTELRWKTNLKIFNALLDQTHNMFFRDLFSSLTLYARPIFFFQEKQGSSLNRESYRFQNILWVQEAMYNRQLTESMVRLTQMYTAVQKTAELQMQRLREQYPQIEQSKKPFIWHSDRGRDHLHVQITRDLIDKIGTGRITVGSRLPSEAKLAAQYKVSVATIRKALASLNELGYAKTQNVKGTTVCMQDENTAAKCMQIKVYRKDTLRYLSGLQLMILLMKPAARSAFPFITQQALSKLQYDLQHEERIPLDCLTALVLQYVPLETLRTLLTELGRIVCWGYYYSFYPSKQHGSTVLNRKSIEAVNYLQAGNQEAFSTQLCICYAHILDVVRSNMIDLQLFEASYMKTPDEVFL